MDLTDAQAFLESSFCYSCLLVAKWQSIFLCTCSVHHNVRGVLPAEVAAVSVVLDEPTLQTHLRNHILDVNRGNIV